MTEPDFTFDEDLHEYRVDGKVLPGVTTIVDAAGLWPFTKADEDPSFYLERGRNVHLACELDDLGDLDDSTLDDTTGPRLEAWRKFRRDSDCKILANEQPLWHRTMGYAGTLDRLILWGSEIGILDIKCGGPDPAYGIQTAGYQLLVNQPSVLESLGLKGSIKFSRWSVHLGQNGTPKVADHIDQNDLNVFKYCVAIHAWKRRHRWAS